MKIAPLTIIKASKNDKEYTRLVAEEDAPIVAWGLLQKGLTVSTVTISDLPDRDAALNAVLWEIAEHGSPAEDADTEEVSANVGTDPDEPAPFSHEDVGGEYGEVPAE